MRVQTVDVIKACNLLISPNKGISLEEESVLQKIPKLKSTNKLNAVELVNLGQKIVFNSLNRKNITSRDLKKAVFNLISLD